MGRIAFYPCCGNDILQPALALTGVADDIIYCDISSSLRDDPFLADGHCPFILPMSAKIGKFIIAGIPISA
jgi:hypothetical protein